MFVLIQTRGIEVKITITQTEAIKILQLLHQDQIIQEAVVRPPIQVHDLQEVHLAVHPEEVEDHPEVAEAEEANQLFKTLTINSVKS